jgi:SAM-dependent methyltransferase
MKLIEILQKKKYKTDKHTYHKYIQEYYEEAFSKYQDKSTNLLEIGVLKGESLKLWRDYFKQGKIVGIDIFIREKFDSVSNNLRNYDVELDVVDSFEDDLYSVNTRQSFIDKHSSEGFDIIIDDGLHTANSQYKTFYNFKSLVNPGGVFVIEDVRDESVPHLSKIENIQFLSLNDEHHPKKKQYIAVIEF